MNYFRLSLGTLILGCALPLHAQREDQTVNHDWRFRFSHQVERNSGKRVDLPHTWNTTDALVGKIDYKRGIGNYTKKSSSRPTGRDAASSCASKGPTR